MKKTLKYVAAPFHFAFKTVLTTVITLMFVSSLLVNATMLTWQTGALAIGGMFASATGISAVANSLKHGNDTLKKKRGKLVAEADGLKRKNGKLVAEADGLKRKNGKLVAEADGLKRKNGKLVAEADGLKRKNGKLAAEADGLKRKNGKLAAEADGLKRKNGKLVAEVDGLKARNLTKNKAVEKITSRIADRTTRSATLNVAAIPVEAIPGVGIGVALAVTTWELTEACGIMRDMKELNIALGSAEPVADDAVCGMELPTKKQVWDTIMNSPGAAWKAVKEFGVNLPDLPGITQKKDPDYPRI